MPHTMHQKVRVLLQAAANKILVPEEQELIDTHLAVCEECRTYAQSLNELEAGLRRVMGQQWNMQNAPLPLQAIKDRSKRIVLQNKISGTIGRFAVVPLLTFAFVMAVKMIAPQPIVLNAGSMTSPAPQFPSHTPTPFYQRTATELTMPGCNTTVYIVQENDTLESIAARYAVSKESIMIYNGLMSEEVPVNTELVIPVCTHTPTNASTTPTITTTTLPFKESVDPSPQG